MLQLEEWHNARGVFLLPEEIAYNRDYYNFHNYNANTDWIDAITRLGFQSDQFFKLEGGGDKTLWLEDDNSRFLMKPATIGLDEMTTENIITVDLDGQRVGGSMPRHNEVFIHSEVLRARSDLHAVIHTHAPHAVAFSSLGKELLPVNNEAGYFYKRLPIFS
jgi:ribulose-5-phosphate 4-epimerase/fuculose-1-phosphate aldolase